ncbi:MAG TPA: acetylxylan esterase [Methylomirabilota bacterium]
MRRTLAVLSIPVVAAAAYAGQPVAEHVAAVLDAELQPRAATTYQLTQYMASRVPPLPAPKVESDWSRDAARLRRHVLDEIVFRGWPREWVTAAFAMEDLGVVMTSSRYRIRKLRYEIVPGMRAPAILCEPVSRSRPAPAVLNLIGHEEGGKAIASAQQRCVAFAKMGVVALTPEWPGFGELAQPQNAHDFAPHLEAAGANALGFFYLAMRRALDHLAQLPSVDRRRIGVTGLSGGGWQSVVLGALDERVGVVVEVAGVGSLDTTLTHPSETDEIEENATDLGRTLDYPQLIAMRAPRPTLLIHNANDECCFRAGLVKPYLHDAVKPFFALYGKQENLAWHENVEPGTHNYERDNRRAAYRFFAQHFGLRAPDDALAAGEPGVDAAVTVGVPRDNLTILGVAKALAARARRAPFADRAAERARLIDVVRYHPSRVTRAWPLWSARADTADTLSYRLDLDSELGATAVWLRPHTRRADAPMTIVLHDDGRAAATDLVAEALARGDQVIAVNLLFFGDMVPEQPPSPGAELGVDPTARPQKTAANYQMLLSMLGERGLGIQASQLLAVARWAQTMAGANNGVRVETRGPRSQLVALVAAALEPRALAAVTSRQAIASLRHLLDAPVPYRAAPELFCLDLYKDFDVDRLTALAEPTSIYREGGRP